MTVKQRVHERPEEAQVVIRAYVVKLSIERSITDPQDSDWERLTEEALIWWGEVKILAEIMGRTEAELAVELVKGMREQKVWGKVLRNGTV